MEIQTHPKGIKAPFSLYPQAEKWPQGTVVELNSADTTALKMVPGIGSVLPSGSLNTGTY